MPDYMFWLWCAGQRPCLPAVACVSAPPCKPPACLPACLSVHSPACFHHDLVSTVMTMCPVTYFACWSVCCCCWPQGVAGWVHEGLLAAAAYVVSNTVDALAEAAQRCPGWPLVVAGKRGCAEHRSCYQQTHYKLFVPIILEGY
jgi:hypothetical protein